MTIIARSQSQSRRSQQHHNRMNGGGGRGGSKLMMKTAFTTAMILLFSTESSNINISVVDAFTSSPSQQQQQHHQHYQHHASAVASRRSLKPLVPKNSLNNKISSSSSSSLYSTPVVKSSAAGGSEQLNNNNNSTDSSLSATTIAAATVDVSADMMERAFAIPSTEEGLITETALTPATAAASAVTAIPPSSSSVDSLKSKLLSADVLGPVISVLSVVAFLFYCMLQSTALGDGFQTMDLPHKMDVLSKVSWFPESGMDAQLSVALVMAFSAFAQALTGFGFAVVAVGALSSMPWLLHSALYDVVTPVAATLGALVGFILLIPYAFTPDDQKSDENPGLEWNEILSLLVPCTVLTPVGIQLHDMVDPLIGTRILAGLIMGFVSYKLYPMIQDAIGGDEQQQPQPALEVVSGTTTGTAAAIVDEASQQEQQEGFVQSRMGAILFGSLAGIFGGAFDVQGPPLCVYGDAKGWTPAQFRNNILTVVALNSALVVFIGFLKDGLGCFYYSYFCLTSLPGVLLGVAAGQYASERIDPVLFKNLVLVMCLGLGIQLLTVS